jgi:hypothetical protein
MSTTSIDYLSKKTTGQVSAEKETGAGMSIVSNGLPTPVNFYRNILFFS